MRGLRGVKIDDATFVWELVEVIKRNNPEKIDKEDELQLFLAKRKKDAVQLLVVPAKDDIGLASNTSTLTSTLIAQMSANEDDLPKHVTLGKRKSAHPIRVAITNLKRVEPFVWNSIDAEGGKAVALTDEQQRERYRAYMEGNIGDVLTKNKLCVYSVETGADFLKIEIPGHDIDLVGSTDMIILSDLASKSSLDFWLLPDLSEVRPSISEAYGNGIRESLEQYYDIASVLGPDVDMSRAVARRIVESIPILKNLNES
ncbi:unnamed protein product [Phytophthora lilii]|uniref:Unnamed protein product n=1 Tax=Phytophthora lilii TaxID=2077276 RepID=A0A9W6TFX6_9STRA|nr:unnamed protein product [Phytophthora lilii]